MKRRLHSEGMANLVVLLELRVQLQEVEQQPSIHLQKRSRLFIEAIEPSAGK